jgi:N-acetylmuramoyl-L-alanine amidase
MAGPSPRILLAVAHTPKAPGAVTPSGLTEHAFSARACDVAAGILDERGCRAKIVRGSRAAKIKASRDPEDPFAVLVEPHFNASENPGIHGYQAIYAIDSKEGKRLARCCCRAFEFSFAELRYHAARWIGPTPVPGPFVRLDDLPILTQTPPPAVITEYLFATSPLDRPWLERETAADECGAAVALAVLDFLAGGGT